MPNDTFATYATTDDLLKVVKHMKKDGFATTARVEVYIEGSDTRYGVTSISHYSVIPNVVLRIEKINDNEAK